MLTVVVRVGLPPQQIDDFPEGCKRSCKGAVHIKPGTLIITDGELEHVRKSRPELRRYLQLISRLAEPVVQSEPPSDPPGGSKDEPPPPPETETVTENPGPTKSEESGTKKRSRKRGFPDAH